ncbi:hypothetical protein HRbin02_00166 [Candidatus Calditenuaceae archaeon HR02]|nr:hypothetical protein HRbin02_00166 [Candidatus Calditenuaceae archaeon HR02]
MKVIVAHPKRTRLIGENRLKSDRSDFKFMQSNGSRLAKYHTIKRHQHDLQHEYALAFRKVV